MEPIRLWHGGQRWQGPPELRPAGKGHSEHGSGLYLTTSAETARKYAKGGGSTLLVELDPNIRWLDEVRIPLKDMEAFLKGRRGLRGRDKVWADLLRASERMKSDSLPAEYILNLMVNHDALKETTDLRLLTSSFSMGLTRHSSNRRCDLQPKIGWLYST